jgi:hypothetical protein
MSRRNDHDEKAFHEQLDYLKLPFTREHYAEQIREAAAAGEDHLAPLMRLIEGEAALRKDRSVERRIRLARFPVRKTIDQFDWTWPRKINRLQIQNLFRLQFLEAAANVVLIGGVGLGKSHLAVALGYTACQHGHSVLFASAIDIVNTLCAAQASGRLKFRARPLRPASAAADRRARLPAHRQIRRRPAVPDHQSTLRMRLHRDHNEPRLQEVAGHLQQRQHPHLGGARPAVTSCRDGDDRGQELPDEGQSRRVMRPQRRRPGVGLPVSNFKPPESPHVRAVGSS